MIYIANFSYTDEDSDYDNYCLMPCAISAETPEDALDKLAAMLASLRESGEMLAGASEIYLDSLIEMEHVPAEGLLTQWQTIASTDDGLTCTTAALPEVDEDNTNVTAYGFEIEGNEDEPEPFLVFDEE